MTSLMMRCRMLRSSFISSSAMLRTSVPKESTVPSAADSLLNDQSVSAAGGDASGSKKSWGFLRFGILAALTGSIGTAGYGTYGNFLFILYLEKWGFIGFQPMSTCPVWELILVAFFVHLFLLFCIR